jgi:hypothetical protein
LDLEAQLDSLRGERMAMLASIDSLARVLRDVGVESELEIFSRVAALRETANAISGEISQQRAAAVSDRTTVHALDRLKTQAQALRRSFKLSHRWERKVEMEGLAPSGP